MSDFDNKWKNKLDAYEFKEEPSDASVQNMMQMLDKVMPQEPGIKSMPVSTKPESKSFYLKIAASFALLVVFSYLVYQLNDVTVSIGNRARQHVTLPDGSVATLNAASELSYNKLAWHLSRNVNLQGEAFFEVKKGEKFTVISDQGSTQVLGTSFNVFARDRRYAVKCNTGRVQVTSHDQTAIIIPGEGVELDGGSLEKFSHNHSDQKDWRKGEFNFDSVPFGNVVEEFERQFAMKVKFPVSLKDATYTGYFNNRNMDQALKLICGPFDLTFQIKDELITLKPTEE